MLAVGAFGKGAACEKPERGRATFCLCRRTTYFLNFFFIFYSLELFLWLGLECRSLGVVYFVRMCADYLRYDGFEIFLTAQFNNYVIIRHKVQTSSSTFRCRYTCFVCMFTIKRCRIIFRTFW